jgi:hypothetical protein
MSQQEKPRREFWIIERPSHVASMAYRSPEDAENSLTEGPYFHFQEVGAGLIPVEDVLPLLGAISFYAKLENWERDKTKAGISLASGNECFDICLFDFERNNPKGKDYCGRRARESLAAFRAKYKDLK